jgi:hypothetical protein
MIAATTLGGLALFLWAMRKMQLPLLRLATMLAPVALAGIASLALMFVANGPISSLTGTWMIRPQYPRFAAAQPAVVLALVSAAGFLAYLAIVLAFSREIPRSLFSLIRRR